MTLRQVESIFCVALWCSTKIKYSTLRHTSVLKNSLFQRFWGEMIFFKSFENFFFKSYGFDFCFRMCLHTCISSLQKMVDIRQVPKNIFQKNDPPRWGFGGGLQAKPIINQFWRSVFVKTNWIANSFLSKKASKTGKRMGKPKRKWRKRPKPPDICQEKVYPSLFRHLECLIVF